MKIGFAVADIRASDGALPKSENEFLWGQIAPALWNITFVFHFIEEDWFSINIPIKDSPRRVLDCRAVLNAGVGNPRSRVIEKLLAVVNGKKVVVRIRSRNDLAESFEIFFTLLLHEIVVICERPPDVAKGGEPTDDVTQVT